MKTNGQMANGQMVKSEGERGRSGDRQVRNAEEEAGCFHLRAIPAPSSEGVLPAAVAGAVPGVDPAVRAVVGARVAVVNSRRAGAFVCGQCGHAGMSGYGTRQDRVGTHRYRKCDNRKCGHVIITLQRLGGGFEEVEVG